MNNTMPTELDKALQLVTDASRRARAAKTIGPTQHLKAIRRALAAAEAAQALGATDAQIQTAMEA